MEDLFKGFRAWLGATEEKLGGLSPPAGESGEREQQLQEAKVCGWVVGWVGGEWKEGRVGGERREGRVGRCVQVKFC